VALLAAAAYGGYRVGDTRGYERCTEETKPSTAMFEELADLRHIKAQLEHPQGPVPEHDHIYPREPDRRKLGWLRYHCVVPSCPAIKWVER
jgi:hypothetical protein